MKLLVIVAVCVIASASLAEDIMWEIAPKNYVEERVPFTEADVARPTGGEIKTQDAQTQTQERLTSTEQPRSDPSNTQPPTVGDSRDEQLKVEREANEIAREEITLSEEGNRIQRRLARIGAITILSQVILTLVQIYFIWTANSHAAAAAKAAQDSVDLAGNEMKIANRAYLFVRDWRIDNYRASGNTKITYTLRNAGHTPANIERLKEFFVIDDKMPDPLTPVFPREEERIGFPLDPQGQDEGFLSPFSLNTADHKALEAGTKTLYAAICLVYSDVFDQKYWVVSTVRYSVARDIFVAVESPGYNRSGPYREEDWKRKQ